MNYKKKVIKKDLIYPELSYQIVGIRNREQISEYLKVSGLKLGILANFGSKDVKFKRIVNL